MHRHPFHVLLAHDDSDALHRGVDLLKRRAHIAAGSATREDAEWWLSVWPVDLVIASARFDGCPGVDLALAARRVHPEVMGLVLNPVDDSGIAAEAARQGVGVATAAVDSEEFAAQVARLLSGIVRRPRWPRKDVADAVSMRVGDSLGRLVDVSYGGLKFEVADDFVPASTVELDFPRADLRLNADVVWTERRPQARRAVIGASVTAEPMQAAEWRAFVDRL